SDAQHPMGYDDNPVTNEAEAMAVNNSYTPDIGENIEILAAISSTSKSEKRELMNLLNVAKDAVEALTRTKKLKEYGAWAAGVTDELNEKERDSVIAEETIKWGQEYDSKFDELQGQFNRQHKGWVRREAEAKDSEFDWLEERFRRQDESRRARIRYVNDELRASPSHGRHKQTRIQSLYKMVEAMSGNPTLLRQNPQALENLARFVSVFKMHSSLEALVRNAASNGEVHDENGDSEAVWDGGMFNRRTFSVRAMPYHPEAGNGYHNATPKPNPTTPLKIVSVPIPEIVVGHSAVSGAPYILSAGRK
ncbi:hypothetical protein HYU12_04370, partial [Candidatus Woesearchaeota archaeon]|nr:hypothetical protein [Candidatus Woesearchaeota archaeon]